MKTVSELFEKNKSAILLIRIVIPAAPGSDQGRLSIRGTGFVVSEDGQFITCAHVYKNIPEDERKYTEGQILSATDEFGVSRYKNYPIELVKIDEENDVAIMRLVTSGEKFSCIKNLGDANSVKEGDEVVFLGFPLATELLAMGFGITLTIHHALVSAIKRRGSDKSLHFFFIDTHTNKGSSGSPLFSTKTGEIVGIVSGHISQKIEIKNSNLDNKLFDIPADIGLCRPINYVKQLL